MSLDQQINLWNAIGTWIAGIGTLSAVIVSLWLARRSDRVDVRAWVGLGTTFGGDGSPPIDVLLFSITNRATRPLTVENIGWTVGYWPRRKYCIQTVSDPLSARCPVELQHGRSARFIVSFKATPNWSSEFAAKFLPNRSWPTLLSLRAQFHTSVGATVTVRPRQDVLQLLRKAVEA